MSRLMTSGRNWLQTVFEVLRGEGFGSGVTLCAGGAVWVPLVVLPFEVELPPELPFPLPPPRFEPPDLLPEFSLLFAPPPGPVAVPVVHRVGPVAVGALCFA